VQTSNSVFDRYYTPVWHPTDSSLCGHPSATALELLKLSLL